MAGHRYALRGPLLGGGQKRLLRRVVARVELVVPPNEHGEDPRRETLSRSSIDAALSASTATARTPLSRAVAKLGARDRAQLGVAGYQTGPAPSWMTMRLTVGHGMLIAMRIDELINVLEKDGVRLADAAGLAGLDVDVPTCPGWQIRDLLRHIGGVHRWARAHVATGRRQPYSADEEAEFFTTVNDDELLDWFREGHRTLVDTLAAADEGIACWTFLPAPSPLAFWARRQAHETAVHRADAESAAGTATHWDPAFAVDGIDELLSGFFGRAGGRLLADPPRSMALVPTDIDVAWTFHIEPSGRRLVAGEQPAQLTIVGPSSELYLLLWNRTGTERLELRGDEAVLDLWRARGKVRWS